MTFVREELQRKKVAELKALVKEHNLHYVIRGYSKMAKASLVDALMKHTVPSPKGVKPEPTKKKRVSPTLIKGIEPGVPKKKGEFKKNTDGNETMSQKVKEIEQKAKSGGYSDKVAFEPVKAKGKLDLMTVGMGELREYAKARDIVGSNKMKRFEIIKALEDAKKIKKRRKQKHLGWKAKHDKGVKTPHHIIEIPSRAMHTV